MDHIDEDLPHSDPGNAVDEEQDALAEDTEDDFHYERVDVGSDEEEGPIDDGEETFQDALRTLQRQQDREVPPEPRPHVTRQPEVIDDFIRNFLVKAELRRTLEVFESEWYELKTRATMTGGNSAAAALENVVVPDVYLLNSRLEQQILTLREELEAHRGLADRAKGAWEKMKKERDYHKTSHNRVVQEKSKLAKDLKRLQAHCQQYEPTIAELRHKYESAMKEKMLVRLDRDKLASRVTVLEEQVRELEGQQKPPPPKEKPSSKKNPNDSSWPKDDQNINPFANLSFKPPNNIAAWTARQTIKGHSMSVPRLALHPKSPTLATASDDSTWKLWTVPTGELIISGEGHKGWVAGIDIHPKGTHLATGAGDHSVKLWDFSKSKCVHTFTEHTQPVWMVTFHHTGDFLASCSADHTARIWDINSQRCRNTLRGHVDSVTGLAWMPYSNVIGTCSGDKTVSLWDCRTGYCSQTFYGHENACNAVTFGIRADLIASSDADGKIIIWDVRTMQALKTLNCGPYPANGISLDRSGTYLAAASDSGVIFITNLVDEKEPVRQLKAHEDAVLDVAFDANGQFLVSCGSDATWRFWG
eukprot:TRINITY_DN3549_c0_g1_i1.p1 TRINITY_DN3549_c0_g1~~TRINITY_DN3549_c0_g1_i1.p1  ORF type:complete len:588 (-),score=85.67 TRINITY_DN3549_c0_g1_i1:10-1773(-)